LANLDNIINTAGLTKIYHRLLGFGSNLAVDDLNLAVPEGCTFGFLGPNGAGKTTTIKMLLGLINPTRGSGDVLGRELGNLEAKEQIGFLPEEPAFGRHLKAREFLNLCAGLSHIPRSQRRRRIDLALDVVGLSDRAGGRLGEFSKGMLQRVGIAQAMLHNPKLLILDEPLTGLDPAGRMEIKRIMLELTRRGKTIFFSSHILSDVEELCDNVGILNRGRLILSGPLEKLLDAGGVEIIVEDMPSALLEKIEPFVTGMVKQGRRWVLQLGDENAEKQVKKLLTEGGCHNIRDRRGTVKLEELFMQTIEQNDIAVGKGVENG